MRTVRSEWSAVINAEQFQKGPGTAECIPADSIDNGWNNSIVRI